VRDEYSFYFQNTGSSLEVEQNCPLGNGIDSRCWKKEDKQAIFL
jgi:hypothetical protein